VYPLEQTESKRKTQRKLHGPQSMTEKSTLLNLALNPQHLPSGLLKEFIITFRGG
jgi:hypothetical protein